MNRLHILLILVVMFGAFFVGHEALAKVLTGTGADDTLVGTDGEDSLTGLRGRDGLKGRDGKDRLKGSRGNDRLKGGRAADHLWGSRGNDKIFSGEGNDIMNGETGNDILTGGLDNDTMDGGENNDTYKFADDFGADRISADSAGVDTLNFAALSSAFTSGNGVSIELRGQGSKLCPSTANGCISVAGGFIENVVGTSVGDILDGNPSSNKIKGGGGDDRIESGGGNDEIIPGEGHDKVFAGAGDDLIIRARHRRSGLHRLRARLRQGRDHTPRRPDPEQLRESSRS
jgi:Ca2+-binding RTX toxin-like protein